MQSFFANFLLVLSASATVSALPGRKVSDLEAKDKIPVSVVEVVETTTEYNTISLENRAWSLVYATTVSLAPITIQNNQSPAAATAISPIIVPVAPGLQQVSVAQQSNAWTQYSVLHAAAPTPAVAASPSVPSSPPPIQYEELHSAAAAPVAAISSIQPLPSSSLAAQVVSSPQVPAQAVTSHTAAPSTAVAPTTTLSTIPFLRGVNLGGWLVLEKWMNSDAFSGAFSNAVDQYTFDSIAGASDALKAHWDTFFTQSDIQKIASTGINALRIPIGFWAYDNANTPYVQGADAYLEKAISWARASNMKVWVDLHGSPGSQNGFDNSGHAGDVDWQQTANLQRSISVLQTMAKKYGALEYADVVVGLQLVNEPISWGANNFDTTKSWAADAYRAVKAAATNKNLVIVMHDAFQGALSWSNVAASLTTDRTFGVDSHLYQLFTDSDNALTQSQHISKACSWASDLSAANKQFPTYVGEWSAATNICTNPDGSTTPGTSCSTEGCQCQSGDFFKLNTKSIEQIRRYVEAQLDVFESSTSGYFIWAAKGPGGWGFLNLIQQGAFPNPVTDRAYTGQCGGVSRRAARNRLE